MTEHRTSSELSRRVRITGIPPTGSEVEVTASPEECRALARRFGLPAIGSLACRFTLSREPGAVIRGSGILSARVTQTCRLTLEEFSASVEERFTVRFVAAGSETEEFDPDAPDEIPYSEGVLDLGEATAEQLALALDPWPRKPDAVLQFH